MLGDLAAEATKELPNGQPFSNGHLAHGSSTKKSLVATPKRVTAEHIVPEPPLAETTSEPIMDTSTSMSPSPDPSSVSASTLHKEEGVSATPNASSDSTWEKQSQASQADEKSGEQDFERNGEKEAERNGEGTSEEGEGEKVDSPSAVWDQLASASQLKEAPLPTVNVWQQRALDLKAKAGKGTKPPPNPAATTKPGFQSGNQSDSNSPKDDERSAHSKEDPHGPGPFESSNGHRANKDIGESTPAGHDFEHAMP